MKRSKFSLSNTRLLTCDMGELVPIGLQEVIPGDTFQHATSLLLRVSPLVTPVMHPVHVRIHHWFVPHRLVWADWENFITGGPDGLNASTFPTITVNSGTGFAVGSLADYLGVPTGVDDLPVSALPFRGYAKIWNEFYRDQDLQTALTIDTTDGADTTTNQTLQNVCWEKDRFTSARLTAQKGTEVTLPLGTSALVQRVTSSTQHQDVYVASTGLKTGAADLNASAAGRLIRASDSAELQLDPRGTMYADLSSATAASINDLRQAWALQRYKENRMRFGSRYTEYLRAAFGVTSSDARLQRPEYLGGGVQTIQFSEAIQHAPTTSGTPITGVGGLAGHGISALRSNRYRRFFEEHGYVFSLLSVRPRLLHASGLPRHWSKTTKEDFFQKELQHIGQEEVYNKEVRWAHATPDGVFGYQDRYDDYRHPATGNSIGGEFRSTLNTWHYAQILASDPTLNSTFVSCVPTKRVNQSTSTDCLWVMAHHSLQARRPMSAVGSPGGI